MTLAGDGTTPERVGTGLHTGRWDGGHPGLEVWYQTLTDQETGTGVWVHHELATLTTGLAELRGHVAVFPPDRHPVLAHFAPTEVPVENVGRWFDSGQVRCEAGRTTGTADHASWDLRWRDETRALEVLPRAVWDLAPPPGAQIVPDPAATFEGYVDYPGGRLDVHHGRGAAGRIYGRRNASRWGWLHADLGDGDVLEVVTASVEVPLLGRVAPRALVRLRLGGRDLPGWPGATAVTTRTRLGLPGWSVSGLLGPYRLRIEVTQPGERCVEVDLRDPDGRRASVTHSSRADAVVVLEERAGLRWRSARRWALDATAHAEVGRTRR